MTRVTNCFNCKHQGYCTLESIINSVFVDSWPGNIVVECNQFESRDGYQTLVNDFLKNKIEDQPDCKSSCKFYKYCKYITPGETRSEYDKVIRTIRYMNDKYKDELHLTFTCPSLTKTDERIQRDKMQGEKENDY